MGLQPMMMMLLLSLGTGLLLSGCNLLVEPPTKACCNPDEEPGLGENPPCVEGATCCADGEWACNEGDGRSTCEVLCTGKPCGIGSKGCSANEYCERPVGACDDANVTGVCRLKPDVCAEIFQPACGCDGQTYGNECSARMAGVSVAHEGECGQACGGPLDVACPEGEFCKQELGACLDPAATGACAPRPQGCDAIFDPVCGCDGESYSSECSAWSSGVSAATYGTCE
jgi:hypothetical protein